MIVVCDVNEVWRRKPFQALANKAEVLGVAPADWFLARRSGLPASEGALEVLPAILPLGWASRSAKISQELLWKRILKRCRELDTDIGAVVVTSPHYHVLLDHVPDSVKTYYYASDDYRSYEGWGSMVDKEREMVNRVDHAFFVSDGLKERARNEYGVDERKLSVSMNASEPHFFPSERCGPCVPPCGELKRPIAGVVGGINDRLDFDLLLRCADLPELGTLLLVGPVPASKPVELESLLMHPRCVAVGSQPHAEIHRWFQCLDVGLIPYVPSEFNRLCSPMRLFDHLASGAQVVSSDACEQVNGFRSEISIGRDDIEFLDVLRKCLRADAPHIDRRHLNLTWAERANAMLGVMEKMEMNPNGYGGSTP